MMNQKERGEFIAVLAQELPGLSAEYISELARNLIMRANTVQRYAVLDCNRGLSDAEQVRDARNDAAIQSLAASVGCGVVLSGDPRGAVVKITVPSGRTNDWGQTGICVPTNRY